MQDTIWHYTKGGTYTDISDKGQEMIDDAELYGAGFKPGAVYLLAIYIYIPGDMQDLIIEIDLPPCFYIPKIPLGTLTALVTMVAVLYLRYRREH